MTGGDDDKPSGDFGVHSDHSHEGMGNHAQASSTYSMDIGDGKTYHGTEHTYADKDGNISTRSQESIKDSDGGGGSGK